MSSYLGNMSSMLGDLCARATAIAAKVGRPCGWSVPRAYGQVVALNASIFATAAT
jgi:hypothetical protein